jgi:hypothetical protein
VRDDVKRMRLWLESDQMAHWQSEFRKRSRRLEQARAELMTARLSRFVDSLVIQERAVKRATLAMDEATAKMAKIKEWLRNYDQLTLPLLRRVDQLADHCESSLPEAILHLHALHEALLNYLEPAPPP